MRETKRTREGSWRGILAVALAVGSVGWLSSVVPGVNMAASAQEAQAGGGDDGPKLPKFDDVVKGMKATPGMMTFYRYDDRDPARDHTRLLVLVPANLLNADLMMANSVSRGPDFGNPLDDGVLVRWERNGNRLLLVAPDVRLKTESNAAINEAVKATYRPTVIAGLPILAVDNQGGVLVDVSTLVFGGSTVGVAPQMIRRDISKITKVKSFPENVLVDVDLAIMSRGVAGSAETVGISYAFRKLPPLGAYKPRMADERIGYFTTVRQDWTTKYDARETLTRYVNRWDLKKQDPSLELSPPEKPIVFIIEKNVPIQFRKYVAEGIAEWNKAFEKIGITGAIVVQQQTDDNEFAGIDPEDARYNFIRWIVTGRGYAMGPSRPDPRTGQLLDADIIFDDSMVRFYTEDVDILGPKALAAELGESVIEFFRENPAFLPAGAELSREDRQLLRGDHELLKEVGSSDGERVGPVAKFRQGNDVRSCSLGNGLRHQMAIARLAAQAGGGKKLPERLMGEIIRDVVTHEVGHTLGLRHNFKGSSWLSVEEIKQRRDNTDDATWSSVMDYNPYLYFPGDKIETLRHLSSPTIGPYDYWAIEYGYSSPSGKGEAEHLSSIAAKTNTRELAYASDEDVMGFVSPDPTANRFDMGSDPVAWAKMRIALADELMKNVKEWGIQKDDPNYYFRSIYSTLMFERVRYVPFVARQVTGLLISRSRAGDPNAPAAFTILPPAKQREGLKFIGETVFSESFVEPDPELINRLGISRWWDWASDPASRTDYPVHSAALSMQNGTLAALTNTSALQRIYDAEKKTKAEDKFTAAELITSVRDMIWSDLDKSGGRFSDSKPMIGSIRRNLQQQYLQNMLATAELRSGAGISPDLQNMVRYSLRELSAKIGKALDKKDSLDFASRAHLAEAKTRIDRVIDAPFVPAGGGGVIILQGRETPSTSLPNMDGSTGR